MASKGIRFTVLEGARIKAGDDQPLFYFHSILGNNKIVQPSEGYERLRDAFDTVNAIWYDTAVAQGNYRSTLTRKAAISVFVECFPVPYTKDSLKPK